MSTEFLDQLSQSNLETTQDIGNNLNTDAVAKEEWIALIESSDHNISQQDVDLLGKIRDDAWVVSQCFESLVNDYNVQLSILKTGQARVEEKTATILRSLDEPTLENATTNINTEARTWLHTRLYFLQYIDRLHTFNHIWRASKRASSFSAAYGEFRDANLTALAIGYARDENDVALNALFLYHGSEILPYRLSILSQIPETADYGSFYLPRVSGTHEEQWPENLWRHEPDPVEILMSHHALDLHKTEEQQLFLDNLDNSMLTKVEYPASADVISTWYCDLAKAADKAGLCGQALKILRYAKSMGVSSIQDVLRNYEWLCKYVYTSSADTGTDDITMEEFVQLSPYTVLEGLLRDTNAERVADDVARLGIPWLETVKKQRRDTGEDIQVMLYHWLLQKSSEHIDWCSAVMDISKPTIPVDQRIIKDDYDLSRLVLVIIYMSNGRTIQHVETLFECLPTFDNLDRNSTVSMSTLLPSAESPISLFTALQSVSNPNVAHMLDILQDDVESAIVLSRYNASVPFRWFLEEHPESARRQLCIRMACGVTDDSIQDINEWDILWEDMESLHARGIFESLDLSELQEIFFVSMLRSGAFELARQKMSESPPIVDMTRAEQLVLNAANEFYDNDQRGNRKEGNLGKAWKCLEVLPTSTPAIDKERDLIKATHTLISEYNIKEGDNEMMPIQIRHTKDKLTLVSKLIAARPTIYRQPQVVLELIQQLGYKDDPLAEIKTLSMLALSLISNPTTLEDEKNEHYQRAYELCKKAFDKANSVSSGTNKDANQIAWKVCYLLGKAEDYEDYTRRLDVLGMALAISPTECIGDTLKLWRKLDERFPDKSELIRLDLHQDKPEQSSFLPKNLLEGASRFLTSERDPSQPTRKRDQIRGVFDWLTK